MLLCSRRRSVQQIAHQEQAGRWFYQHEALNVQANGCPCIAAPTREARDEVRHTQNHPGAWGGRRKTV
eukprot:514156-Amphidinium_carterae.1